MRHLVRACVAIAIAVAATGSAGAALSGDALETKDGDAYAAAFVSQTVPSFIELFTATTVTVTMRNTGTASWLRAAGDVFLATQFPQDNYYWCIQDNPHGMYSGNRVLLPYDVAPGAEVTFVFVVKPLSCGFAATAPLRFRMLSQLHGTFGETTRDPGVVASSASQFVSQQAPSIAPARANIPVTVVFKNLTPATWRVSDGYALTSASPSGNTTFRSLQMLQPERRRRSRFASTCPTRPAITTSNGR